MYSKKQTRPRLATIIIVFAIVGLFDFANSQGVRKKIPDLLDMRTPIDSLGVDKPKVVSIYGELSFGAESPILGFPALEVRIRPLRELLYGSTFYIGGKASAWIIIAGIVNAGVESGFQYKWFTCDASLTYSELTSWEASRPGGGTYTVGPAKKITFNPKFGFSHYAFSFKVGPAFNVREYLRDADRENQDSPDLLKYFLDDGGITSFNIELGMGIHLF
jgi:hypothetical protein